MTKRNLLDLTTGELLQVFGREFPELVGVLRGVEDNQHFEQVLKQQLNEWCDARTSSPVVENEEPGLAARQLKIMIEAEGSLVTDLSTGEPVKCETWSCLWSLLTGRLLPETVHPDFLIDLYHLCSPLYGHKYEKPGKGLLRQQMNRWPTGLDKEVTELRTATKQRIIGLLVEKVEHKQHPRYTFAEGLSHEEKIRQIETWWSESRFHLTMAIRSPKELNTFLGHALSDETMAVLTRARKKKMPFFVTPYYLSLLNSGQGGYDDATIRSYILYSGDLVDNYGQIRAWEKEDIVESGQPNAAGWLMPDGHNIHRRYPEVAILIPDSMGRACGGLCAPCQRMYDFQSENLNFEFDTLKPKETWDQKLRGLMRYFETDSQLRDILITGGDALMSQNKTLKKILDAVCRMALRKREANLLRADGEKYAEIQRIRLGSRLLAYLPMRINDELVEILKECRKRGEEAGISQFVIQTHFESPLEVTPEAERAIRAILSAGWLITNQLVFTAAASRRGHSAKLRQTLNRLGVICYYTFSVKGFAENRAMFAPNSRSIQEQQEEKIWGLLDESKQAELLGLLQHPEQLGRTMPAFMKQHGLPFLATDRSVLNLPAIGKSMTFSLAGIARSGERILRFDHDAGRRHSPVIDHMDEVYITENKSVASYMRQLRQMGEDIREYQQIWSYTEGVTEPRFKVFEYPTYPFGVTEEYTNLKI